jgi:hypothetical protein
MPTPEHVATLHRYFITADRMRVHMYGYLAEHPGVTVDSDEWTEVFLYMSLWYGSLYVVVEGWRSLHLQDEQVDRLLTENKARSDLLYDFRNGVFHYQPDFWSKKKVVPLLARGEESAHWIAELHSALSDYFHAWHRANGTA